MDDNTTALVLMLGFGAILAFMYIYLTKTNVTTFTRDPEGRIIEIMEKKI